MTSIIKDFLLPTPTQELKAFDTVNEALKGGLSPIMAAARKTPQPLASAGFRNNNLFNIVVSSFFWLNGEITGNEAEKKAGQSGVVGSIIYYIANKIIPMGPSKMMLGNLTLSPPMRQAGLAMKVIANVFFAIGGAKLIMSRWGSKNDTKNIATNVNATQNSLIAQSDAPKQLTFSEKMASIYDRVSAPLGNFFAPVAGIAYGLAGVSRVIQSTFSGLANSIYLVDSSDRLRYIARGLVFGNADNPNKKWIEWLIKKYGAKITAHIDKRYALDELAFPDGSKRMLGDMTRDAHKKRFLELAELYKEKGLDAVLKERQGYCGYPKQMIRNFFHLIGSNFNMQTGKLGLLAAGADVFTGNVAGLVFGINNAFFTAVESFGISVGNIPSAANPQKAVRVHHLYSLLSKTKQGRMMRNALILISAVGIGPKVFKLIANKNDIEERDDKIAQITTQAKSVIEQHVSDKLERMDDVTLDMKKTLIAKITEDVTSELNVEAKEAWKTKNIDLDEEAIKRTVETKLGLNEQSQIVQNTQQDEIVLRSATDHTSDEAGDMTTQIVSDQSDEIVETTNNFNAEKDNADEDLETLEFNYGGQLDRRAHEINVENDNLENIRIGYDMTRKSIDLLIRSHQIMLEIANQNSITYNAFKYDTDRVALVFTDPGNNTRSLFDITKEQYEAFLSATQGSAIINS